MTRRPLLGAAAVTLLALAPHACSAPDQVAAIGLVMKAPAGLLDEASAVELVIFDAGQATCAANGHIDNLPSGSGVQRFDLERGGCAAGAIWCKQIELAQDGTQKTFAVIARSAAGVLAEGCTTASIDQDPLEITIKVQRFLPPSCCNDGQLQPGEQCDSGQQAATDCGGAPGAACLSVPADEVCECNCTAREVPLDREVGGAPLPAGTKGELSLTFAPGDDKIPNALRAVFTNDDPADANGGSDVQLRILQRDLYPVLPVVSEPLSHVLNLPLRCSSVGGNGSARMQRSPGIAPIAGTTMTAVVYLSNETDPTRFDVLLSRQTEVGCADVAPARVNDVAVSGAEPDVAGGPSGAVLVVWRREEEGRIQARIARSDGTFEPAAGEIDIAGSGAHARVAGSPDGWVVVYESANDVFRRTVDPSGVVGPEVRVNAADGLQDQPDVATLGDRSIVVWRSNGDVFFQRYDGSGASVAGDQDAAIHASLEGEQANPAVAGSPDVGDFFVVAWEELARGDIGARFVGGSAGFLFNSVTGQNDDFGAGQSFVHPGVPATRLLPAVAVGGSGFVAIGWQDEDPGHPGVYVRRFPAP